MRSRAFSVLFIAGAAACAPSAAPSAGPSPDAEAPPVRALLSERDRLALSPDQVVALDSVSRAVDVTDRAAPRRGIIKGGLMRLSLGKPRDQARDVAVKQNRAVQAVEQLLRPDQRQRLCELYLARQTKAALRDTKRAPAGQRHDFAGSRRAETLRTWPWCSEGSSHSTATAQSDS